MVDPEVVRRRLRELDRRLGALRAVIAAGEQAYLADPNVRAQTERHLQVAIQSAIDVAVHILAEDSAATPEDYGSAFVLLADLGIIAGGLAEQLRRAAGLRNILVHAYIDVDPQAVWRHLQGLDDLVAFAEAVEAHIRTD